MKKMTLFLVMTGALLTSGYSFGIELPEIPKNAVNVTISAEIQLPNQKRADYSMIYMRMSPQERSILIIVQRTNQGYTKYLVQFDHEGKITEITKTSVVVGIEGDFVIGKDDKGLVTESISPADGRSFTDALSVIHGWLDDMSHASPLDVNPISFPAEFGLPEPEMSVAEGRKMLRDLSAVVAHAQTLAVDPRKDTQITTWGNLKRGESPPPANTAPVDHSIGQPVVPDKLREGARAVPNMGKTRRGFPGK